MNIECWENHKNEEISRHIDNSFEHFVARGNSDISLLIQWM